jgi:hypothetical protein
MKKPHVLVDKATIIGLLLAIALAAGLYLVPRQPAAVSVRPGIVSVENAFADQAAQDAARPPTETYTVKWNDKLIVWKHTIEEPAVHGGPMVVELTDSSGVVISRADIGSYASCNPPSAALAAEYSAITAVSCWLGVSGMDIAVDLQNDVLVIGARGVWEETVDQQTKKIMHGPWAVVGTLPLK